MKKMLKKSMEFYFKKMQQLYLSEEAEDICGIIKMIIHTEHNIEEWYIHLNEKECRINTIEVENYDTKISLTKETFLKTFMGIVPMETAYNNGDVIVEGDVDFAAFLIICFPRPYAYDIWFYSLEDRLKKDINNNLDLVFKFIIKNSPQVIIDDDLPEPLLLEATEENAIRYIHIKNGLCEIISNIDNYNGKVLSIFIQDKLLMELSNGSITLERFLNKAIEANIENNDSINAIKYFCELFHFEPILIS